MDYLGKNIYTKLGDVIDLTKNNKKIQNDFNSKIKHSQSIKIQDSKQSTLKLSLKVIHSSLIKKQESVMQKRNSSKNNSSLKELLNKNSSTINL